MQPIRYEAVSTVRTTSIFRTILVTDVCFVGGALRLSPVCVAKGQRTNPLPREGVCHAAIEAAIAADRADGLTPIAIVATAGTVSVGAIDALSELAKLARREDLWLHVDGAYGGLAALAVPEKFQGLDQADSVSLDAHKWLYQPVDCGCLLYRDPEVARETFSFSGDYVKTRVDDPIEGFAFFEESIELSRRFRVLKLWMSLQYHGRRAFRNAIRRDLEHAQFLAAEVGSDPELELVAPVHLIAVCFRHRSGDNLAA